MLTYRAGGPEAAEAWAAAAREHLAGALGVPVVGRARKVCVVLDRNHVTERSMTFLADVGFRDRGCLGGLAVFR